MNKCNSKALLTLSSILLGLGVGGYASAGYMPGPYMCGWIQIRTDQPNYAAFVVVADGIDLRGLKVSDRGWRGASFYDGEGAIMTLPSNDAWDNVETPTVVELGVELDNDPSDGVLGCPIPDSTIDLSPEGDQLFLYWGEEPAPVFICGIHTKRDEWDTIDYNDENSSLLPDRCASVAVGWTDRSCHNAYYAGPDLFYTVSAAWIAVAENENWVRSDDPEDGRSFTRILPTVWGFPLPSFGFSDRRCVAMEGNGGITEATFSVRLFGATGYPTTIDYSTAPGTATPGVDYATSAGTLCFPVGVVAQQVVVEIMADADVESDETFLVYLSNPSHGIDVDTRPAICTIRDDDPPPIIDLKERCDMNKDGQVDEKDLLILLGEWHKEAKNKPTR